MKLLNNVASIIMMLISKEKLAVIASFIQITMISTVTMMYFTGVSVVGYSMVCKEAIQSAISLSGGLISQ